VLIQTKPLFSSVRLSVTHKLRVAERIFIILYIGALRLNAAFHFYFRFCRFTSILKWIPTCTIARNRSCLLNHVHRYPYYGACTVSIVLRLSLLLDYLDTSNCLEHQIL